MSRELRPGLADIQRAPNTSSGPCVDEQTTARNLVADAGRQTELSGPNELRRR